MLLQRCARSIATSSTSAASVTRIIQISSTTTATTTKSSSALLLMHSSSFSSPAPSSSYSTSSTSSSSSSSSTSTDSQSWRRRLALLGAGTLIGSATLAASNSDSDTQSTSLLTTVSCASVTSTHSPPILTTAKIYSHLSSPVETITPVQRGVIKEFHINQYAANTAIEDRISVVPSAACPPGGFLAGVFDGHSGSEAAQHCADELLAYLQYYRWSNRTGEIISPRTFLEADHHFLELSLRDKRIQAGLSGACLTVAHVSGTTVRTANAGDCRTIIGKRIPKTVQVDPAHPTEFKYQAVELTTDHQIDTNPGEFERLLREHPDERDIVRNDRVKGRLQPSRGFGDGFYKRREFYSARQLSRPFDGWTPPYTTVEPDITTYQLKPEDEFMVMATDGLFSDLNSQQVVEYVGEWMAQQQASKTASSRGGISNLFSSSSPATAPICRNASTYLIKQSLLHSSEHFIGRRKRENENLSWILQLPQENKRSHHDDVSVLVVFFDHSARFASDAPSLASPNGPPIPPTLQRAIAMNIKPPPPRIPSAPTKEETASIRILPQQQESLQQEKIRSNL